MANNPEESGRMEPEEYGRVAPSPSFHAHDARCFENAFVVDPALKANGV